MKRKLVAVTGTANPSFAEKVCAYLDISLTTTEVGRFPDGEIDVKILDDVRGSDVYVIQSTCPPVNENLMEVLILMDCLRRLAQSGLPRSCPISAMPGRTGKRRDGFPFQQSLLPTS